MWTLLAAAHAMSLEEALSAGEARSPTAELSAARVAEAEARVAEVRGHLLPSATVSAAAVAQREVTVNFADNLPDIPLIDPSAIEPLVVVPGFQLQTAAEVTQPLVAPQGWAAGTAAREGVALAEAEEASTRVQVRRAVLGAWHASAEAHALVADAQVGVELAQRLLVRGEAMVEIGVASPDQILPFRRAVASAKAGLAMAEAGRETADGILAQLTGLEGGADAAEPPASAPELDGVLSGVKRADLRLSEARVEAAQAARTVEKRAYLPTVAAKGGVYVVTPAPDLGVPVNWRVMVGATIPVFQGGSTRARVSSAGARVSQAEAARRVLAEQAEVEVRRAHGELSRSLAALSAREEALDLAEQAVKAAEARSEAGEGSLLAIQQAQAEQLAAQAEVTRAKAAAARAADNLWLAVEDAPR
ncbi:MAG: TolC family protein [Alphaproteobacteria bacterium]|nr:TolC family protein [Alphaproteobacteria bacterium]